jgi:hypothetical protein
MSPPQADNGTATPGDVRRAAFFCVSNDRHFLGAVALLNSLRQVGHNEPFFLVDCGLTDRQRELVSGHVTLLSVTKDVHPMMLKLLGPLQVDPDVAIILDADVIAVRPLTDLIAAKPVVFVNDWTSRFEPEWIRLGYGRLTRIPYLNSGHMILPRASGLVPLLQRGNERVLEIIRAEPEEGRWPSGSFHHLDQDVLNALISSLDPAAYVVSDEVAYWPFEGSLEGARLLHHILAKPWLRPLRPSPYSREMARVLATGPVEIAADEIPVRLRGGTRGSVARACASVQHTVRDHTRGKLGIRRRLAERTATRRVPTS